LKCDLDVVAVQEVRWDKGGSWPADDYTTLYRSGDANYHLGTGFFLHKGDI